MGLPRDALLGRGIFDLSHPPTLFRQITESHARSLRGETVTDELLVPGPGGERWYERHARPLFDAHGHVEAIAISSRDIDARKRAEEKLARELAFRERVMGILGHDLRSPVSAILALASVLQREDGLSNTVREGLERLSQLCCSGLAPSFATDRFSSEARFMQVGIEHLPRKNGFR